ncbi:MAG: ShlB/FhaC/HecB family hemolysin secretion/activation protein [Nitrospirota bacterium]|nr:ShlB/FhaC/HecB family hemolysin secretion/activation protein [Nitrospirota bacterium]
MVRRFGGVIVALGLMMGGGMADAWAVADVSVQPVLPDRPVLPGPARPASPAEPPAKSTGSNGATPAEPSTPASNHVEPVGFSILEFVVDGSTLLSREKIDEVLNKYKGPGKTIKDIDRARVELEKAYQRLGYPTILVVVPEQSVDQGSVRLDVVEGHLLGLTVTGNRYFSRYNILGKLPSVQIGALLYEPDFVKQLDAVNANPDLKIAPVLKPGSEQGTVDLELKATDRLPLHAKMTGDNKGPFTTPAARMTWEAQYGNLWGQDHILTLQTTQTPTNWGAVQAYGFSYVAPLIWPDHLLAVYASKVSSNSTLAGTSLPIGGGGDIAVAGNATVGGFRYLFPIFKGGKAGHQLSFGADFKRLEKTEATFPGDLGTAIVLSPIQYLPVSAGYTGTYPDSYGSTTFTTTLTGYVAGLIPGGGKKDFQGDPNNPDEFPGNRAGSTGTFGVVKTGLSRMQPLPNEFLLSARIDGQWASEPLIPAEQFFAGGMDTVRGYIQNEALGDNALLWRAELYTPDLPSIPIDYFWQRRRSSEVKATMKLVAFYDYARLWTKRAPAGQQDISRLEGAGGGLRMRIEPINLNLQLDHAMALQTTGTTKRGDTFTHFMVSVGF